MYEKIIERFCAFFVLVQSLVYLGVYFDIVGSRIFPSSALFLWSVIGGVSFSIIGVGLLISCAIDLRFASRHERRDMGMNELLLNRFMTQFSEELNKERRERGVSL